MPQMSPLLWLNLYTMFVITLVIFIAIFFFLKSPNLAPTVSSIKTNQELNWKW